MNLASSTPLWIMAALIFGLRILDVSLGTIRTIAVVNGRIRASVMLGFGEILIWVAAISSVIANLDRSPVLLLAYAAGFAVGNATGILLERHLAWGTVMVRFISTSATSEIARYLRKRGQWAATFRGEGEGGEEESIVFGTCAKPLLRDVLKVARRLDPTIIYSVEPVLESAPPIRYPLPHLTGWRGKLRK